MDNDSSRKNEKAPQQEESSRFLFLDLNNDQTRKTIVTVCYISIASMLGTFLRVVIAQLFGEECKNPGSVGWLAAAAPLCVTRTGETSLEGGIIFADLPSNLLGSFIMGLFQDGIVLGLAIPMAISFLSPQSSFQTMTILHTAIKTGFCGSLTTFSSWNSEMVVLIFGTGTNLTSQVLQAFLGYVVGMETAVGSFSCGKALARRLHSFTNPVLAKEAKAKKKREAQGVFVNTALPEFERRYLPRLEMGEETEQLYSVGGNTKDLEEWRVSTENVRRIGHELLNTLIEIENSVLATKENPSQEALSIAESEGWNLQSLYSWSKSRDDFSSQSPSKSSPSESSILFSAPLALCFVGMIYTVLLIGLFVDTDLNATSITRRTMVYALLLAPPGALLRWKLSVLNGRCKFPKLKWLPLGTFYANLIGSILSITMVATEYHIESTYPYNVVAFWTIGTMRAIKVGFAGSLTTVSTFVSEISGFLVNSDHAYPYMFITLGCCSTVSVILYSFIVYTFN